MSDQTAADVAVNFLQIVGFGIAGLVIGTIVSILTSVISNTVRRRTPLWAPFSRRLRIPQRILFMTLGTGMGVLIATQSNVAGTDIVWRPIFVQAYIIALILAGALLLTRFMSAVEEAVLLRFDSEEEPTGYARRVKTQMQVIRRIVVLTIWVSAGVGVVTTFPSMRGLGATFFASAGIVSVVAGIAAQSALGNVFAGLQTAFTDSIRVGDVVVVEGEFGFIEELTLTYVVVRVWDDRRIVLPSNYFTTTPFQNWTRRDAKLLGTVYIDVDWLTPIQALRVELQRIVENTDVWDGRACALQVTDAVEGRIQIRCVVSAASAGELWDLRCTVREQLIEWMQSNVTYSVPRLRIEPKTAAAPPVEERRQLIDKMQHQWDEEHADKGISDLLVDEELPIPLSDDEIDPIFGWPFARDNAKKARKEAEKADKEAQKEDPTRLSGHDRVIPAPSSEETRIFTQEELADLVAEPPADYVPPVVEPDADTREAPVEDHKPRHADTDPDIDTDTDAVAGAGGAQPRIIRPSLPTARQPVQGGAAHDPSAPAAQSRLYSGSPDGEERGRLTRGPSERDIAEREDTARRRYGDLEEEARRNLPQGSLSEMDADGGPQ